MIFTTGHCKPKIHNLNDLTKSFDNIKRVIDLINMILLIKFKIRASFVRG